MKNQLLAVLMLASTATLAYAEANVELTDENKAKIVEMLTEQGYEVGKIKIEDGMYEAYAKNDEGRYEIFLNGDFEIVRTEEDD